MKLSNRTTCLTSDRLLGWVDRFIAAHDGLAATEDTDDGLLLTMLDGSSALLTSPWPPDGRPGRGVTLLERLASLSAQERRIAIVLVRRAGYAVGVAVGGTLLAHKAGTAAVRSRGTDAGAAIAGRAAQEAARVFTGQSYEYLATGGDKPLVEAVLAAAPLRSLGTRPRLTPLPVADPNVAVLRQAAADFCAISVRITDTRG